VDFHFDAALFEWRGPAPFYFLRLPDEMGDDVREVAAEVTYGWGMVPVQVRIGDSAWETSLWPKDGGYLVPVKAWVRKAEKLEPGQIVHLGLDVAARGGRPAV
jgi:hypothetical protein